MLGWLPTSRFFYIPTIYLRPPQTCEFTITLSRIMRRTYATRSIWYAALVLGMARGSAALWTSRANCALSSYRRIYSRSAWPPVATLPDADLLSFEVLVPEGTHAGDAFDFVLPDGREFSMVVPDGVEAGHPVLVEVPAQTSDELPAPAETSSAPPAMQVPDEPLVYAVPDEPLVYAAPAELDAGAAVLTPSADELEEVWLNPQAKGTQTLGEAIQNGDVVVCLPQVASEDELGVLLSAGIAACDAQRQRSGTSPTHGRNRFAVADPSAFSNEVVLRCEEIMLRVLDRVDEQIPSIYDHLFRPCEAWAERQPLTAQGLRVTASPADYLADTCPSLRDLYMAGELEWSEGEPAINVYTVNGRFNPHTDHMALTVLIPLTCPTRGFSGGGTGFWTPDLDISDKLLALTMDENVRSAATTEESKGVSVTDGEPTVTLKPSLGTALIFGGDLTHAGMAVESGAPSPSHAMCDT